MIEKKAYECSFCGRYFNDKEMCEKHEKQHVKPVEIIEFKYQPVLDRPSTIIVKMNDNTLIEYGYSKKIKK